ncbi:plant intracellular Ras-group-related LRR protein 6 [Arachis duranensis]|uniref:Plant intracellular Ras-group-related LRR protein 6 n=1 Tax=Arachis duranensis TaxID=130453 RepID=A0A6P4B4S8_ARADU|nr:plant intracellular Ras-group-related LRR protein 6 [Arachis duranensis]
MLYVQQQPMIKKAERSGGGSSSWSRGIEEERLEIVDLSGMSLDSLPNPSLNLAIICKLDLSNNNLQNIPESLTARLVNLVVLDVHSNQLRRLPNSIGCLCKLKVLNVAGNMIQYLPKTIDNCKSLEELNANFNKLIQLPENIGLELRKLKKLSVNSNKLLFLPRSTSNLTSLKLLDARLNCLRSLPEDLEKLVSLETLNISQNFHFLRSLPCSLGLIFSLVELDISYNRITSLPPSIACLNKLQKLCVDGNPLMSPPLEVVEQGLYAVKGYLYQKMNSPSSSSESPSTKKKSWVGKLVKYKTFSNGGETKRSSSHEEREAFVMPDYKPIDTLASPRYMGIFSPRRLFSPRNYFTNYS